MNDYKRLIAFIPLLVLFASLPACGLGQFTSVSPDTNAAVYLKVGETQAFQVNRINIGNAQFKIKWSVKRNGYQEYFDEYDNSDTFEFMLEPEDENRADLFVVCDLFILTYRIIACDDPFSMACEIQPQWAWTYQDLRFWNIKTLQDPPTWVGDFYVHNKYDLSVLADFSEITGSLLIIEESISVNGEPYFPYYAIRNLEGLNSLTSIGGSLYIENCDLVTNLDPLSNLTSVGGWISINGNDALTSLGSSSLCSVGEVSGSTIKISNNMELCTNLADELVDQVQACDTISGAIVISGNKDCSNP